ncbi:uncharacterized protein LOC131622035 [Vicia villosa]|uniref:uncharacterized protein LOC131622035 n=1 Tax=Vicia villosa TaxID=3911 RepID=UPI00273BE8F7|nr:uncharacterized protein LOC131622035 [Vicia villosa]
MGRNPKVCTSCIHNCRMFHRPLPPTTTSPSSFYKFMLRRSDLKLLYLPPKLKRTMSGLVGKSFNLEDSTGSRWDVTLSNVDDSLAFKEGWDVFSLDHKLEVGDLVVFSSIDKLKFGVKIYDESVCERVDFSKTRIRKKRDRNGEFVRQDPNASLVDLQTDVPMQNQHMEIDLGGTQNNIGDTCFITSNAYQNDASFLNKDPMVEEVLGTGDASYASKLELHGRNNCPMEHKYPDFVLVENNEHRSIRSNGEVQEGEGQFAAGLGSDHAAISRGKHALHAFELETSGRNNSLGESDKNAYEKTSILKHEEYKKGKSLLSEKEIPECSFAEGLGQRKKLCMNITPKRLRGFNDKLCGTELPKVIKGKLNQNNEGHFETAATVSCENSKERFNKISNLLDDCIYLGGTKELPVETTPKLCSVNDKINVTGMTEVIKRELNEDETSATVTDKDHLELSEPLPLSRVGLGSKTTMVVILKDPLTRKWPVLCTEKTCLRSGWSDFQRANNIKTGDVCVFKVENKYEHIVAVHTDHK